MLRNCQHSGFGKNSISLLFPLMEKGNPAGLRKEDQGQTNGSARLSGNAHEELL
jgi:hypothetical protein